MSFLDDIEIRDDEVDGEKNWHWIKNDTGAFTGPKEDWLKHHKTHYLKHLKKRDVVVTAGTNCGMYARFYSKLFKHVYAFEPEPSAFHCMVNNCPFENVIKINAAVGIGNGIIGIKKAAPGGDNMNVGMNVVVAATEEYQIPMMAIDSLNLNGCDLLQLDVEGYELPAIQGAIKTIQKYKPVIVAERFASLEQRRMIKNELNYEFQGMSAMDAIYVYNESSQFFSYKVN